MRGGGEISTATSYFPRFLYTGRSSNDRAVFLPGDCIPHVIYAIANLDRQWSTMYCDFMTCVTTSVQLLLSLSRPLIQ